MKKLHIALIVATLVALTAATASAEMWNGVEYDFVDKIDDWGLFGWDDFAVPIVEDLDFSYTHTIDDFIVPDEYLVTEAWLNLDFTNDETDEVRRRFGVITYDNREYVEVVWDGSTWVDLDEVDDGQYDLVVGVDWLNDDGELDVTISVSNPGWNWGTAYLDHSVLYGNVARVPVPGAALLGVLGLSAAGMKLRRRKSA